MTKKQAARTKTKVSSNTKAKPRAYIRDARKDPNARRRPVNRVTQKELDGFINDLYNGWTVHVAAKRNGFTHATFYNRRLVDDEFAKRWDEAYRNGASVLETEAQRRAVEGVPDPIYYQGEEVGSVQKYSDILMMFLMKARDPSRFRENVNVTNSDGSLGGGWSAALGSFVVNVVAPPATLPTIEHDTNG